MGLTDEKKSILKEILKKSIICKFANYQPESKNMPFHYRLLGKDRMYLYSFIQSLNTTFGTSIYEPVAIELAKDNFKVVRAKQKTYNRISSGAQHAIQSIIDDLSSATKEPNQVEEYNKIRQECKNSEIKSVNLTSVDIWLESHDGELFLMDMKTVKPNIGDFKGYKRMLLEWSAAEMLKNPNVRINSILAIPYNPYEPQPYARWTLRGMLDLKKEILVANELWDFLGGPGAYQDLLYCFELAGIELRPQIDRYFARYK